jgi:hypothetical protein
MTEQYRGYTISFENPPIPIRDFDYIASDPNSDGLVVGNGATVEACKADIDRHIEDIDDDPRT